jgi:hypothetical protein
MIAHASLPLRACRALDQAAQDRFLQMLPTIRSVARYAFCNWSRDQWQELAAEVIANSFVAFVRLVERDKADLAYPTVLATYGVKQVLSGHRVGNRLNVKDASSPYCQQRKGVRMRPLQRFEPMQGKWREIVVEDGRATPADVAATRIDFADWLRQLPRSKRNVAKLLATGEGTSAAAQRFRLSKARISQLRSELRANWDEFQGERFPAAA